MEFTDRELADKIEELVGCKYPRLKLTQEDISELLFGDKFNRPRVSRACRRLVDEKRLLQEGGGGVARDHFGIGLIRESRYSKSAPLSDCGRARGWARVPSFAGVDDDRHKGARSDQVRKDCERVTSSLRERHEQPRLTQHRGCRPKRQSRQRTSMGSAGWPTVCWPCETGRVHP